MSADVEETVGETVDQDQQEGQEEVQGEPLDQEEAVQDEAVEEAGTTEAGDGETTEGGEETAAPDWITDDIRELAKSYDLEESELSSFESGADFQRACRLVDRHLTRGREPAEEAAAKTGEAEESAEPEKGAAAPEADDDLTIDLSQYAGYDPEVLRVVKAAKHLQEENAAVRSELAQMRGEVEGHFSRLERERQEAIYEVKLDQFHDVMDTLDADLFGGDKKLSDEAEARREKVWNAYRMIEASLPQSESAGGRPAKGPPVSVLVRRAAMLAFGDEMLEAQRKGIYKSIQEQSRGRRPSPSRSKASGPPTEPKEPMTIPERAQEILKDPDLAARFDKSFEESGNAPQ